MQIMRGRWVKCTTHSDALAFVSQRRGEKKRCCGWAWHPRCNSAINVGAVPFFKHGDGYLALLIARA